MGTRRKAALPAAPESSVAASGSVLRPAGAAVCERAAVCEDAATERLLEITTLELKVAKALAREERRRRQLAKALAKTAALREQLAVVRAGMAGPAPSVSVAVAPAAPVVAPDPGSGIPDPASGIPDPEAANFLRLVAREAAAAIRASSRADHAAHTRVGARRAEAAARDRRRARRRAPE